MIVAMLLPQAASAASLTLRAMPSVIGAGDSVLIMVTIDSSVPANAFSGALRYPSDMLEPIGVSDGNSIVSMWITRPNMSVSGEGSIPFAGITPGGFSGDNGMLFSVVFKAKKAGSATVALSALQVLRNDGVGGAEAVIADRLTLPIRETPSGGYVQPADITPPEPFAAYMGTDSNLFGGRAYLAFSTADKGSGIDHYRIAESRLPSFLLRWFPLTWSAQESPYEIQDQRLTSSVYIEAVDREGNARLSVYPPRHLLTQYEKELLMAILIGATLMFFWILGRRPRAHNP